MARMQRIEIIKEIGKLRNSGIICYFSGDRENINTRIAPDVIPIFYQHLEIVKAQPKIDLFLYTRGGDVLTPWRLVHLIREYTDFFGVIIPFRAYSSGTLLCLGADEIVMGKMGELGPIDPSVVNAFNPQDPNNPAARIPVNIEDVYSFLALAREESGLRTSKQLREAFSLLAERIHPLALGNVHRNYLLIRSLAKKLLLLQENPPDDETIQHVVDSLTEKLYAHNHMISRQEASAEIGLRIVFPEKQLEEAIWALYEDFAQELKIIEPFNPVELLHGSKTEFEVCGGFIETEFRQDSFIFSGVVERKDFPEKGQVNVSIIKQGWKNTG